MPDILVELPPSLSRYFEALDGGSMEEAAANFSLDCLYAPPQAARAHSGSTETEPRALVRGRAALLDRFIERGLMSTRHTFLASFGDGQTVCLYGMSRSKADDAPWGTFLSTAHLDDEGLVKRYVGFYCRPPLADDPILLDIAGSESSIESAAAMQSVRSFYEDLRSGRGPDLGQFSRECYISVPPTPGHPRPVAKTPEDAIGLPWAPGGNRTIDRVHVQGAHLLVEGAIKSNDLEGTLLASATVSPAGLISRYVEFYSSEVVPAV